MRNELRQALQALAHIDRLQDELFLGRLDIDQTGDQVSHAFSFCP